MTDEIGCQLRAHREGRNVPGEGQSRGNYLIQLDTDWTSQTLEHTRIVHCFVASDLAEMSRDEQ